MSPIFSGSNIKVKFCMLRHFHVGSENEVMKFFGIDRSAHSALSFL